MINIYFQNNALEIAEINYVSDIKNYFEYYEVSLMIGVPPGEEVILESETSDKLRSLSYRYKKPYYKHMFVTEKQYNLLNLQTTPVFGNYTVASLLSTLSIPYKDQISTALSTWILPALNFKSLLRELSKFTSVLNGGAPRFILGLDGELRLIDLKYSYIQGSFPVIGYIDTILNSKDWIIKSPTNLKLHSYSSLEIKSLDIENERDKTWAKTYVNDTTGYETNMVAQAFKNEYTYNRYTQNIYKLTNVPNPVMIGNHCTVEDSKLDGVVIALYQPLIVYQDNVVSTVELACL